MPRGSKPGERRGGRQRGTPNKKTALVIAAFDAAASNADLTPLDFLLGVMRDSSLSPDLRMKAAQAAAPYVHAKPGGSPTPDSAVSAKPIDPANYGPREARKDQDRLHHFYCKRISPPSCGGGALSESEDAEEAQLTARIAAFEKSPEGLARQRIRELDFASFSRRISDAETEELESLQKAYPPDPNDPMARID